MSWKHRLIRSESIREPFLCSVCGEPRSPYANVCRSCYYEQRRSGVKHCYICGCELTSSNWPSWAQKHKRNICHECSTTHDRERYRTKSHGFVVKVPCESCHGANLRALDSKKCKSCWRAEQQATTKAFRFGKKLPKTNCINCGRRLTIKNWNQTSRKYGGRQCITCERKKHKEQHDKHKEKTKRKRIDLKIEVITAYGGQCACCGEREMAFLSIDHVQNDGAAHRRSITGELYVWLKRNNFPQNGFQCLCMNCNWAKSKWPGGCPHQLQRQQETQA